MTQAICRPYMKARRVNATDATFPSRVPTTTALGNTLVGSATSRDFLLSDVKGGGGISPYRAMILPYGLGADNDAFLMRVVGWRRVTVQAVTLYVPTVLAAFTCTMSGAVGVAGSPVLNTERFCDTIALITGFEPTYTADVTRQGTVKVFSPQNDLAGWVDMEIEGCENVELTFADSVNTPSKNALVSFIF